MLEGRLDAASYTIAAGLVSDLLTGGESPVSVSRKGSQDQSRTATAVALFKDSLKFAPW